MDFFCFTLKVVGAWCFFLFGLCTMLFCDNVLSGVPLKSTYSEATAFCRISNPIFCRNVSTLHNGERLLGPFVLSKPGLQSRVARVHGVAGFFGGVTIHKGFNKFVRYYIRNGCLGKGIPLSPPPWKGMEGRWCETGE